MDNGSKDLTVLLSLMEPYSDGEEYVFITTRQKCITESDLKLRPVGVFQEKEGLSLIILKKTAEENGIGFDSVFGLISLNVHSSLDAVGLTALISTKLADEGISVNVVAAYYHDHIFVQYEKAERALVVLKALQSCGK